METGTNLSQIDSNSSEMSFTNTDLFIKRELETLLETKLSLDDIVYFAGRKLSFRLYINRLAPSDFRHFFGHISKTDVVNYINSNKKINGFHTEIMIFLAQFLGLIESTRIKAN